MYVTWYIGVLGFGGAILLTFALLLPFAPFIAIIAALLVIAAIVLALVGPSGESEAEGRADADAERVGAQSPGRERRRWWQKPWWQ